MAITVTLPYEWDRNVECLVRDEIPKLKPSVTVVHVAENSDK